MISGKPSRSRDDVSKVNFVSADDAWDKFKSDYFKDNADLADGLKMTTRWPESDNYEVYMKTVEKRCEPLCQEQVACFHSAGSCQVCQGPGRGTEGEQV